MLKKASAQQQIIVVWKIHWLRIGLLVFLLAAGDQLFAQTIKVNKQYPSYQRTAGVSGNLNSVGSDTLNNLMTLLAERFRSYHPNVNVQIEGKGSSTAPPALIEGVSQLGPMSRAMKASELEAFEKKYRFKPTAIPVAVDALAVYVHKNNPLKALSLGQVDAIFSSTRRGGYPHDISRWNQVGLKGSLGSRSISFYGRNSASGTYGYFKQVALFKGDYRSSVKEQPGSSAVVSGIAADIAGIGYSGIGYRTADVRVVPLSAKTGGRAYPPSPKAAMSGNYPLSRLLYVYVSKQPRKAPDKLTGSFLDLVLSKEGQEVVVKTGYFPLPYSEAVKIRKQLGLR